jgi:putative flippase GtrA
VNVTPLAILDRVTGGRGLKAMRYSMVSVVGVGVHQIVLLTALVVAGLGGVPANLLAASVAAVPAFLLNKRWVWGRADRAQFRREVLPFWVFTVAGVLISTGFVYLAESWSDSPLIIAGASITGFGVLWVAKFLFLDQFMFAGEPVEQPVPVDL